MTTAVGAGGWQAQKKKQPATRNKITRRVTRIMEKASIMFSTCSVALELHRKWHYHPLDSVRVMLFRYNTTMQNPITLEDALYRAFTMLQTRK